MRDFTIEGFAAFLAETVVETEVATRRGLEEAARIVEREAKAEIGHYQDAAGQFPAWAELADSTKDERVRLGYTENDPGLRSGEMRDSIQHRIEGHEAHIGSDDDKLVWFELGTIKQPPRSVLAGALIRKTGDVIEVIGRSYVAQLIGPNLIGVALEIGHSIADEAI